MQYSSYPVFQLLNKIMVSKCDSIHFLCKVSMCLHCHKDTDLSAKGFAVLDGFGCHTVLWWMVLDAILWTGISFRDYLTEGKQVQLREQRWCLVFPLLGFPFEYFHWHGKDWHPYSSCLLHQFLVQMLGSVWSWYFQLHCYQLEVIQDCRVATAIMTGKQREAWGRLRGLREAACRWRQFSGLWCLEVSRKMIPASRYFIKIKSNNPKMLSKNVPFFT